MVQGVLGTFDSLNPFIVKGLAVQAIRGYVIESLMARGYDEPFTLYGLLARTVETDDARSYVTFSLDPAARFSDGTPVTADDVVFSWQLLRDHGRPNHRTYYSKVAKAESARCAHRALRSRRRQRPRIAADPRPDAGVAEARHRRREIRGHDFGEADRQRALRRSPRSMPARASPSSAIPTIGAATCRSIAACGISTSCVSTIIATPTPISKAFKTGLYDVRSETDPTPLADRLRHSRRARRPHRQGGVRQRPAQAQPPTSSSTRGAPFSPTSACAQAIALLFDFEWVNRNFFFDLYRRSASYLRRFGTVRLSPPGRRARARAARAVSRRGARRRARRHLVAAGDRRLRPRPRQPARRRSRCSPPPATSSRARRCASARSGRPLRLRDHGDKPRRGTPRARFRQQSRRAPASTRRCGWSTPCNTTSGALSFDFDMIEYRWEQSLSPGNEQALLLGLGRGRSSRARATTWACASAGDRRHDRGDAARARAATISSPRCARSTAC